MTEHYTHSVLSQIIETSNSEIILFMILIFIILIGFGIPVIKATMKNNKEARAESQKERESLNSIIQNNTEAMTALKFTLDSYNKATVVALNHIESRVDDNTDAITKINDNQRDMDTMVTHVNDVAVQNNNELVKISDDHKVILDKIEKVYRNTEELKKKKN